MVLTSVCTFAQSGNNEPLRGDVNGDGKVDLADVTELVNIILSNSTAPAATYYWYLGTEKLTTDEAIETNANSIQISNSSDIPNPFTLNDPTDDHYVYLFYPKAFGTATMTSSGLPVAGQDVAEFTTQGFNLTKYNGWRFIKGNDGLIVNITFPN